MAICNLFKKLTDRNGIFYTFSQYTEDVTKSLSNSNYKVVPSKFYVLNINYEGQDNESIPLYLQNQFENGCAYCRNILNDWTPEYSKNLFWNCMGLIDKSLQSSIQYIGDINMDSFDEHNGTGYDEIFCYIPNNSKKIEVSIETLSSDKKVTYEKNYVEGYKLKDFDPNSGMVWADTLNGTIYTYGRTLNFIVNSESNNDSYSFNTIIPCYDIYTSNSESPKYSEIPMGIYFTGCIENGVMKHPVTVYTTNDEIYNEGTSYGLRICMRFTPSSFDNASIEINDIDSLTLNNLMIEFDKSLDKMNEIVSDRMNDLIKYKELYSIFKNSRTNIPYIKSSQGNAHWFINGRDTGQNVTTTIAGGSIINPGDNATEVINQYSKNFETQINSLQNENKELKTQIAGLTSTINKLKTAMGFIEEPGGAVSANYVQTDEKGLVPLDKLPIEVMSEEEYIEVEKDPGTIYATYDE